MKSTFKKSLFVLVVLSLLLAACASSGSKSTWVANYCDENKVDCSKTASGEGRDCSKSEYFDDGIGGTSLYYLDECKVTVSDKMK